MTDDPTLQAVTAARTARKAAEHAERQAVADARNAGKTWAEIAVALGYRKEDSGNVWTAYKKHLDATDRVYRVKDAE